MLAMLGGHYSLTGSKNIRCVFSLVLHSLTTRSQVSVMSLMLLWGHASKIAYHAGISQTLRLLQQHFWSICRQTWELMAAYRVCALGKTSHQQPACLLDPLAVPTRPWSNTILDFVTGLPPSSRLLLHTQHNRPFFKSTAFHSSL